MENKILKPCPFCGGEARLAADFRLSNEDDSYPKWFVECSQCGVRTPDAFKDHIVNVWNRRKEMIEVQEIKYRCDYCGEVFDTPHECKEHEKGHFVDYRNQDNIKIAEELRYLSNIAYDYHIMNNVLGMPCRNFVSLMKTAADRVEGKDE